MRIQSRLVVLVLIALAPIAILGFVVADRVRDSIVDYQQTRLLERVSALRLALDTELDTILRTLRTLRAIPEVNDPGGMLMTSRFSRLLANNPLWTAVGLVGAPGQPTFVVDAGGRHSSSIASALADVVAQNGAEGISGIVSIDEAGRPGTVASLVVRRDGQVLGHLFVATASERWLEFLQRYPIGREATLTLNDRAGGIIARTLNHEKWVGMKSSPGFWSRTEGRDEGTMVNRGLEGQAFYSAFSRSERAGWVLGTGVPVSTTFADSERPALTLLAAFLAAAILGFSLAILWGRRISASLEDLAVAARSVGTPSLRLPADSLGVEEAQTIRNALVEAHTLLIAREAEVSSARDEAVAANRAKDAFLAMLSHELRNPLGAISNAAAVLRAPGSEPHRGEMVTVIDRQVGQLRTLINELLDVSRLVRRKVALRITTVDLGELVGEVLRDYFAEAHGGTHDVRLALDSVLVRGDRERLRQITLNLVENAFKYTPPGGIVRIGVRADGDTALLAVSDEGRGMDPDLLPKVFDPFVQATDGIDRPHGGLGLGLAIVRDLVLLHGGTVTVTSEGPGRGSEFVVRLPHRQDPPLDTGTAPD
jgi:signal transduction histidine kinase